MDTPAAIPGNSSTGPSLAVFGNQLYAAWKGEHADNRMFYASYNGTTWNAPAAIPGNSSTGPSLAVFGNQLYAAWKGEHADQRLFYASFNGNGWSAQAGIPGVASSTGPPWPPSAAGCTRYGKASSTTSGCSTLLSTEPAGPRRR